MFFVLLLLISSGNSQIYEVKRNPQSIIGWGSQVYLFDLDYVPSFDQEFHDTPSYRRTSEDIVPIYDKKIRNTQDGFVTQLKFDEVTVPLLKKYLQQIHLDEIILQQQQKWNILKYDKGHFLQHCDKDRTINESLYNFATEIIIPPKKINNFQKGQLLIFQIGQYIEVIPHDTLWTYVVLPLGIPHEVKQVQGTRISYRRPAQIIRKPNEDYEIFNNCVQRTNIGNKKQIKIQKTTENNQL